MRYALVENGKVINIISLNPKNASDFPNAVYCENIPTTIGDDYIDNTFFRNGIEVTQLVTPDIEMYNTLSQLDQAIFDLTINNLEGEE